MSCEECRDSVAPGALWPWDTWDNYSYGVERHDLCEHFPSDIHAAFAVANAIGAPTITLRWLSPWRDGTRYPRPFVVPPAGYPNPYEESS